MNTGNKPVQVFSQKDLVLAMGNGGSNTIEIRSGDKCLHVRGSYLGKIIVYDSIVKFSEGCVDVVLKGSSYASFVLSTGTCNVQDRSRAEILSGMTVNVSNEGYARIDGACSVNVYDNAKVIAFGRCDCAAGGKSSLTISDHCTASVNGSATVIANDYSQVMIGYKFYPHFSELPYIFANGRSLVYCENNYVVLNKNNVRLSGFATLVSPHESSSDICAYHNLKSNKDGEVTLYILANKNEDGKIFHPDDLDETELRVGETYYRVPVLTEMEIKRRVCHALIGNPVSGTDQYRLAICAVNKEDLYYVRDGIDEKVLMAKKCKIVRSMIVGRQE